jgi:hypothetical protein
MADIELKLNLPGFNAVRNSAEVQSALMRRASAIASRAGSMGAPCTVDVRTGRTRAHARVSTANAESARNNAKSNTLLKSLDAGR